MAKVFGSMRFAVSEKTGIDKFSVCFKTHGKHPPGFFVPFKRNHAIRIYGNYRRRDRVGQQIKKSERVFV